MASIDSILRKTTLADLRDWAGEAVLNRGKGYVERVEQLSRTQDNALVAWVSGGDEYATLVRALERGNFKHACTCPYSVGPCKHAVAVILAAAQQIKRQQEIPLLEEGDERFELPLEDAETDDPDEGEWEDEDPDEDGLEPPLPLPKRRGATPAAEVKKLLGDKDREDLLGILVDLSGRFPEVKQHLLEAGQLACDQVGQLVRSLRGEIRSLTAEPAWDDHWGRQGSLPDYSHLEENLRALTGHGHADAVVSLGEELWSKGQAQVEQSDDDGETAMAIASCLEAVLEALPKSTLAPSDQILWLLDRVLEDDYGLLESADRILKRRTYTRAHWRTVTKTLEARLQAMRKPRSGNFSDRYPREMLLRRLLDAYARAGWRARIIPRLEEEADLCQCYAGLVDELLEAGERDRARYWCVRGYASTLKDSPGIAASLQERLRAMAQKERRYDMVAAYRAQDFFQRPSVDSYRALQQAAGKVKCWPSVRAAVLGYLETGVYPASSKAKGNAWPLPVGEVEPPAATRPTGNGRFPDLPTLIEIAILEKRFNDVVDLYQRLRKTKRWGWEIDKTVAQAVAGTHPDLALDIWRAIATSLIDRVNPKAYEEAAIYLRLMKQVYAKSRRLDEWKKLIQGLREAHKAKRRLMGVLDNLEAKRLVD